MTTVTLPILEPGAVRPTYAQGPRDLAAVSLLRLSVTDRCNLRCLYCMPREGVPFDDWDDHLTAAQILAVAAAARQVGIRHFKVTGGEPTVRRDLPNIIAGLARLQPDDLALTTNGLTLARQAPALAAAGLHRVTVSWDSMQPERLARLTGADHADATDAGRRQRGEQLLEQIRAGLAAAQAAGLTPIKLNMVVIGGINDDEVAAFAALTLQQPWTVRFIEYMPLGESQLTAGGDPLGHVVDSAVLQARLRETFGALLPVARPSEVGVGPANVFQLPGAVGRIGFISAMSQPFCETCNRLRLTARGELRACLFDGGEVDIRPLLNAVKPDPAALVDAMRRCVAQKPDTHSQRGNRAMSQLGG